MCGSEQTGEITKEDFLEGNALYNLKSIKMESKRPIEQIVNEGKAMLDAKDNEIEFIETSFKNVYNEQERQIKSLSESLDYALKRKDELWDKQDHFDKTLRRQYVEKNELKDKVESMQKTINDYKLICVEKNNEIGELKDNCSTYVSKIQDQNDKILEQNSKISSWEKVLIKQNNYISNIQDRLKTERHNKYILTGTLIFVFIGFLIAWYL